MTSMIRDKPLLNTLDNTALNLGVSHANIMYVLATATVQCTCLHTCNSWKDDLEEISWLTACQIIQGWNIYWVTAGRFCFFLSNQLISI